MSSDWNSTNDLSTCGIRSARVNPWATSCCLTVWMNGARLSETVSPSTVTAPPPSPVNALTNASCATRLAWIQASSNAWLWTIRSTWVRTKPCTPLATGPANPCSAAAAWGGSPRPSTRALSASTTWVVSAWMSM